MSDAELLTAAVAALGVATVGLFAACLGGSVQLYGHLRQRAVARAERRALATTQEEAILFDQLRNDLLLLEMEYQFPAKKPNHRHNIHCPRCGRFARRVFEGDDVVFCKVHELQVDWRHMPVDWTTSSAPTLAEGVPVYQEIVSADSRLYVLPITEPIPMLVPDTLSLEQLQEEGAVL